MAESHSGAPLSIELPDGRLVEFARLTMDDWARWTNRVAAKAHRDVLRKKLADPSVPPPAAHKAASEELTRRRPMPEVAAAVSSDARYVGRLLREQATKAGSDPAMVDGVGSFDQLELAQLLTAEAVMVLPLLIPLSRHRERENAKAARAAMLASATASLPISSGNRSDAATAA